MNFKKHILFVISLFMVIGTIGLLKIAETFLAKNSLSSFLQTASLTSQSSSLTNQATASYKDSKGLPYGPISSNTVTVTVASVVTDTVPPGIVSDLTVLQIDPSTLNLVWTAPGDDGSVGTASSYEVRYSSSPLTDSSWSSTKIFKKTTQPQTGGSTERVALKIVFAPATAKSNSEIEVTPNTTYYFGIKATDEKGNTSNISNVAVISVGTATAPLPPPQILTMKPVSISSSTVTLWWRVPKTPFVSYDVRYSTKEIKDQTSWENAIEAQNEPAPSAPDSEQTYALSGLNQGTYYWIVLKTIDNTGSSSGLSNILYILTTTGQQPILPQATTLIKSIIVPEGSYKKSFSRLKLGVHHVTSKNRLIELEADSQSDGSVSFIPHNLSKGVYDLVISIPKTLTRVVRNIDVSLASQTPINFPNIVIGNLQDGDNEINSLDWAVLSGKWGGADSDSDLNQDGAINALDWSVMNKNWGKKGDAV